MKISDPSDAFDPADVAPAESIIENSFTETTRNGKQALRFVLLALTPSVLFITEPNLVKSEKNKKYTPIPSLYLVDSLKVTVFKKSQRQTLKVSFGNESYRYFEMDKTKEKEHWTMWCKQLVNLQQRNTKVGWFDKISEKTISLDWNIVHHKWQPQPFVWNNKDLFLGSKRELEDQSRPTPVPGLGLTENIKFLYLKPEYFGCWDQSEHWVQCESSKHFSLCEL